MKATYEFLRTSLEAEVFHVELNRPQKRNAIHQPLLQDLERCFRHIDPNVRAIVLSGAGGHFCAGMDLAENASRTPAEVMDNSRYWHDVFSLIEKCRVPVIAALHGAVIGGGLELATACHIRVAASTAFYQLPEVQRGIFVGGGATVRVARLLGADRTVAMMLTGASWGAEQGQAYGISHFLVDDGELAEQAKSIARTVADNAPLANRLAMTALRCISDMPREAGLFAESLTVALAQSGSDANERLALFKNRSRETLPAGAARSGVAE